MAEPDRLVLDRHELNEAVEIVRRHVPPTPAFRWPMLDHVAGSRVTVKHENHTPVGAFKVRGGLVHVSRLVASGAPAGIVSATRGNHGQSLAFAGALHGVAVTIFVPHGNSIEKNAAMRALGAEVV
ncbi:MAG: pyridoxal-phosphate dependent enzyme, partial [Actinomycetota bacterium]